MKNLRILLIVFVLTSFYGCSSDDNGGEDINFDGSYEAIQKVIGEEALSNMVSLGMAINTGTNPPLVEGTYELTTVLEASNDPWDQYLIGSAAAFPPQTFKLYDINLEKLTLLYSALGGSQSDQGAGAFISGNGNKFTIVLKLKSDGGNGTQADVARVLSGEKTSNGFINFQMASFMINNYGNPQGNWTENGQGRIFIDYDGLVKEVN